MYMLRPIAAIIRFSFEIIVVALIGLVWLYHDGEISTSVMCVILGCIELFILRRKYTYLYFHEVFTTSVSDGGLRLRYIS